MGTEEENERAGFGLNSKLLVNYGEKTEGREMIEFLIEYIKYKKLQRRNYEMHT